MTELAAAIVDNVWLWTSLAGLALGVVIFLTSVAGLDWSALLVMGTVPVQRELLVGHHSTQLTWTQIALAAFFAGAILRLASGTLTVRVDGITAAAGAVVALYGMSVLGADDTGQWAGETYRWGVALLFLVLARGYFTTRTARPLLITLIGGVAVAGGWALVQVAFDIGPSSFVRHGLMRAHGGFGEPNPFAAFAWAITLPLTAYAVLREGAWSVFRWLGALAATIGFVVLALTQSRGGLLGAAAGLGIIGAALILRQGRQTRVAASIAIAIAAAAGVALMVDSSAWSPMSETTTPANWANQERTAHWAAAISMVEQNPISGVGAGGYGDHFRDATEYWRFRISRGHAHNAYLQVASEIGLPGLLAYAVFLATVLGSLIRRATTDERRWLAVGAAAVTIALVVHQLVEYLHVLSLGVLFAGLWAAALPAGNKGIPSREHNIAS